MEQLLGIRNLRVFGSVARGEDRPARAVVDRMSPGIGCLAATDARQTILPHCDFRMMGTAAHDRCTAERRFSSTAWRNASPV